MNRISFAFRSFFSILFGGTLAPDIALAFGYTKPMPAKSAPITEKAAPKKAEPVFGPNDGAVQVLALLQSDGRLIDFLMEDIGAYSDEQVGSAVRDVQVKAKQTLDRYLRLVPVIDGVEGDPARADGLPSGGVKFIGNVPPSGKAPGGLLRHRGWKAEKVELPTLTPGLIVAPAEIEVE